MPATDRRQEFSSRPYPRPAIERGEPDLEGIAHALGVLFDECRRLHNGSISAAERDHADFIRDKLSQVQAMIRGRIEGERHQYQKQLFS